MEAEDSFGGTVFTDQMALKPDANFVQGLYQGKHEKDKEGT